MPKQNLWIKQHRKPCELKSREILKMHVTDDHSHLILPIPLKLMISEVMGILIGKLAKNIFKIFPIPRRSSTKKITS